MCLICASITHISYSSGGTSVVLAQFDSLEPGANCAIVHIPVGSLTNTENHTEDL